MQRGRGRIDRLDEVDARARARPGAAPEPAAALGRLALAGNRAVAQLLAGTAGAAVHRSSRDGASGAAQGAMPAVAREEQAEGASGPLVVKVEGRPDAHVSGRVTVTPPLEQPVVVVKPDGSVVEMRPGPGGGILVSEDGVVSHVSGSVTIDADAPDDRKVVQPAETTAEAAWLDQPALSFASRGERVVELQVLLNAAGAQPALAVDGQFGPGTLAAVKRFQAQRGLQPDGIVGPRTWAALGGTGVLPSIRSQQATSGPAIPATGGV